MKRHCSFLMAVVAAASISGSVFAQAPQEKRRVAILDFQYGTVMTSVQALFGTNVDVGRGISDLLIDRLLKQGTYRLIERRDIGKIIGEQNFSNSDRADAASAAKIGKLLGVDTVVIGDITQFGRDDKSTGIVGGAMSRWDKYGVGKIGVKNAKAVVAITARLIDVNTGEILASETGKGESKRSGTNLLGGGGNWGSGGGGGIDMGSSNFSQTIIGEAVGDAVTELASKLAADNTKIPHTAVQVSGVVADVSGNTIVINVGSKNGIHAGDKLAVSRVGRVIKDPVTGKPLRSIDTPVGMLTITSVDEGSAEGTFVGAAAAQVGDTVKTAQ
jgi:curli biogenesis system outer membrane secretion channel CsgG